jgi:hypothetical protein
LAGKLKYLKKSCPSTTSSITNPTWSHLGFNLGHSTFEFDMKVYVACDMWNIW